MVGYNAPCPLSPAPTFAAREKWATCARQKWTTASSCFALTDSVVRSLTVKAGEAGPPARARLRARKGWPTLPNGQASVCCSSEGVGARHSVSTLVENDLHLLSARAECNGPLLASRPGPVFDSAEGFSGGRIAPLRGWTPPATSRRNPCPVSRPPRGRRVHPARAGSLGAWMHPKAVWIRPSDMRKG